MSNIRIDIASEFKDRGFKKASKSATMLDRQFKALARTFLTVFSTRQVIAFGKASVDAFAADEVAARRLTQTLASMNLGFEDPRISAFISTLEKQSGVLDDQLRPAMETLLRQTGSVTNSQQLLSMAIDVAAGSGVNLQTVVSDLAKAYVGNTRGLIKYNLGLTKTELASKSFLEIQQLLTQQYSGQNAAFLDTYTGKVNLLKVAYANMQETIGKGLVDAFAELSGKNGIAGATAAMEDFGTNTRYAIGGLASYIRTVADQLNSIGALPIMQFFLKNQGIFQLLGGLIERGQSKANAPKPFSIPMSISGQTSLYTQQDAARKKAEADAAKRQKQLLALQKKAEAEAKKRQALELSRKRAQTIFDMENIQIVAALQGKIDGEQRTRLVTLLALNTENYKAAEKLADVVIRLNEPALRNLGVIIEAGDSVDELVKKLITSQARLAALQLTAEDFPELDNPFEEWENSLEKILEMLMAILGMQSGAIDYSKTSIMSPANQLAAARYEALYQSIIGGNNPYERAPAPIDYSQTSIASQANQLAAARYGSMQQSVNVYVQGNVTTERDLVKSITDSLYETQRNGQGIVISSTGL